MDPARAAKPARPRRVWITGASGFIGSHILAELRAFPNLYECLALERQRVDLTDRLQVKSLHARTQPDIVIHCAALANTTLCESQPQQSHEINVAATQHLAELSKDLHLIFLSSDLVFDGQHAPYGESDPPTPLIQYAKHKYQAEQAVQQCPRHLVLRTSLNAGSAPANHPSFNEQMRQAWLAGRPVTLFRDEYRNPIAAALTARVVRHLLEQEVLGLYHLAGRQRLSRLEIGLLYRDHYGLPHGKIVAASCQDYQGPPRSPDTTLDCQRLQRLLPFPLWGLREWLTQERGKTKTQ